MYAPSIAKHGIHVELQLLPLPTASVERSKLLQVIDNLIKNAVESMAAFSRSSHVLTIAARHEDGCAVISVEDTGHGIREEHHKNIFRFGFTTKENGNGFGLHSAAIAMGEMGGAIRVTSGGWGAGATFVITLPLVQKAGLVEPGRSAGNAAPVESGTLPSTGEPASVAIA
jgi:C4-dicarboxylate-specific signal transduction histidine kinase